jgi:hypothetical protein
MSERARWERAGRPVPASGTRADPDRNPARVLSAIALASIAAGAINLAAAATVGRDSSTQTLAFFVVVAAAQLVWGAVALARAPRWWLALGAVGNLVVVATWVVSRTAGLPVGEFAGSTLPVGFADGLATALEGSGALGGSFPGRHRRGRGGGRRAGPRRRAVTDRHDRFVAGRVRADHRRRPKRPVRPRRRGWHLGRRLLRGRLLGGRLLGGRLLGLRLLKERPPGTASREIGEALGGPRRSP